MHSLWNRKATRRRVVGAMSAGAASLLAAGCAGRKPGATTQQAGPGGATPKSGGMFSDSFEQRNPPGLDPQFFPTMATTSVAAGVMSSLFRNKIAPNPSVSLDHDIENELATQAESPDGIKWTFKLRPGARFHSTASFAGHPLEAEDVKATLVRGITSPQNPNRSILSVIDPAQIQTPDASTVVLSLKYPYGPLPGLLASVQYGLIMPREAAAGGYDPSKEMVGSGPFVLDKYTPDVSIDLKRNEQYFEQGLPRLDGVQVPIIPDPSQAMAQFTAGHLDALTVRQTDLDAAKKNRPDAGVTKAPLASGYGAFYQMGDRSSPFQDIRLRRAVSLALDREGLGKALYADNYQICFSVKLLMGKWALKQDQLSAETQQNYRYNLDEAKRLVQEAGGSDLNIKFAYPTKAFSVDFEGLAQNVYSLLSKLPWKLTLVQLDYNKDYLNSGKGYLYGNFPPDTICFEGINTFTDVDFYLYGPFHSQSALNMEHLNDPTLDKLIDKARSILDEEQRRQAYLEVQKRIADQLYVGAGLPAGYTYTLVQSRIGQYDFTPEATAAGRSWRTAWVRS